MATTRFGIPGWGYIRNDEAVQGARRGRTEHGPTTVEEPLAPVVEEEYKFHMSDSPKPQPPEGLPQIQIDIDDATAQGAYSNLVLLNHNDTEFILDFAYVQPATNRARVRARIISTPRHAKRLLRALEINIRRYEETFGRIQDPDSAKPHLPGAWSGFAAMRGCPPS